jgi:hypothetical protein
MPSPPPIDLDALSLDDLKRLVVERLLRVTAQEEEIRALREELAQVKKVPKRPKLAPGGMDEATEPDKRDKVKAAARSQPGRPAEMTPRPAFTGALPLQTRVSSCTNSTLQSSPDGHLG